MIAVVNAFIALVFGALVGVVLATLDFWVRGLGLPGVILVLLAGCAAFVWLQRGGG